MNRLADAYFDQMYSESADPWSLATRWYERRKYAIILAMLPRERYQHVFEPGCSVGVLTALLAQRCEQLTAIDVAPAALDATSRRFAEAGQRDGVRLLRQSVDEPWPDGPFDLVVLSELGYYLTPDVLRAVLDRECPRLAEGATVIAAHWRHHVADYPMSGDQANEVIVATAGLHRIGGYRDDDVVIDALDNATAESVAARTDVPGSQS